MQKEQFKNNQPSLQRSAHFIKRCYVDALEWISVVEVLKIYEFMVNFQQYLCWMIQHHKANSTGMNFNCKNDTLYIEKYSHSRYYINVIQILWWRMDSWAYPMCFIHVRLLVYIVYLLNTEKLMKVVCIVKHWECVSTHCGLNRMANVSQTTSSNVFSWIKVLYCHGSKFHRHFS